MPDTSHEPISDDEAEALLARLLALDDREDSLVGQIALTLARSIIEGRLPPDYDLNSLELAKRFKTSRTPVREALIVLEQGGLVDIPPRRRPRVISLSEQQIYEIYTLRSQLNAILAERLARTITEEQLSVLEGTLARMASAVELASVHQYFWANVLFHEQSAALAGDATLKKSIDGLGIQVLKLRHSTMSVPGRMQRSLDDHRRLLTAYRENDSILAPALSQSIVMGALRALTQSRAASQ